jgi:hypothetical protein
MSTRQRDQIVGNIGLASAVLIAVLIVCFVGIRATIDAVVIAAAIWFFVRKIIAPLRSGWRS